MTYFAWAMVALPVMTVGYAYAIYPLILWIIGQRMRPESAQEPREWPQVTVAIPAYNEEAQIRGAIEAVLAQDYPPEKRQILILSDASTDRTDSIVREYESLGVELLRMPTRMGKTAAENASCSMIRGSVVINTDSSIRLHRSMVRELVMRMEDPSVGVASSRDVSVSPNDTVANEAEAGYVNYEMRVRALESRTGGIVGASGSGYAIRTELHKFPIRDDLSRDFSAALTARLNGYRAVSVDTAICYVPRTSTLSREYRRKVRTISRGMETLYHNRVLLDPERYGPFSWKLISHKIFRWIVPHTGVAGLIGVLILARGSWLAALAGAAGLAMCATALVVARLPASARVPRLLNVIAFAVSANFAVIHASWRFAMGHEDHIWEPTRRETGQTASAA